MAQNLDFNKLVPNHLKNDTLDSLMSNLFNRFTSQEDSVQVEGYIGQPVEGGTPLHARDLERQINGLVPGLIYSQGTEQSIYTFEDMIDRMNVLGIRIDSLRAWMAEQTFNYTPPLNYDMFINFTNYYWVGKKYLKDAPVWNPENDPEYYVIGRPKATDLVKMPVRLATTRNINREANDRPSEKFTITFVSNTAFTFVSSLGSSNPSDADYVYSDVTTISLGTDQVTPVKVWAKDGNFYPAISNIEAGYPNYNICDFSIVNGTSPFAGGDKIEIEVTYYTSQFSVNVISNNIIGKGTVVGIDTTICPFMYIDGVQVEIGDRILVSNQVDPKQNGIYQVASGAQWSRTFDAVAQEDYGTGTKIFVEEGLTFENKTFEITGGTMLTGLTFEVDPTNPLLSLNDWQMNNYWYHKDDLHLLGLTATDAEVAVRPIIEYDRDLEVNNNTVAGIPQSGTAVPQRKNSFNQIPHFNLFRYDGTHAQMTSGIFFYEEDNEYDVDPILQRRVKITSNSDYVFGLGIKDPQGRHLFFKKGTDLFSIWRPGVKTPRVSAVQFLGGTNRGTLTVSDVYALADNQHWDVKFLSSTEAEVVGTRSGSLGKITVGTTKVFEEFTLALTQGVGDFIEGETFTFAICSPLSPRYVKDEDGQIINYPRNGYESGYAADHALPNPVGAWATPLRMFQNLDRELDTTINYADFLNHARSVLRFQDNFSGSSYGNNNSRNLDFNPGLGGEIRDFGSNFPLLASMLIQPHISPLTILDFAERQNEIALSSIDRFVLTELINYASVVNGVFPTSIAIDPAIQNLADYFESLRASNVELTSVFSDTTSGVSNWPVSMADIGLVQKQIPGIVFDEELNTLMIRHHDGHRSTLLEDTTELQATIVRTSIERSDGTKSAGIFSEGIPTKPYAKQLWMKTSIQAVFLFNVKYDTETVPAGEVGDFWFKRSIETLYEWDGNALDWVVSSQPPASRWVLFDVAAIRNSLVLEIEDRLYTGIHPAQQINIDLISRVNADASSVNLMEIELAKFAAKYNLDAYAPDYVASDAFTWNYSLANVASIGLTTPRARWYDLYKAYFCQFTQFEVDRPDLEPWKLGSTAIPAQWDLTQAWLDRYADTVSADSIIDSAKTVATSAVSLPLTGLPVINGVQLANGDKVLLTAQANPVLNGLYVVSNAGWFRATTTLVHGGGIQITEGKYQNTLFVLTTPAPIVINATSLTFQQERVWKNLMWTEIKALHPTMKLSMNTYAEVLLPPYVAATSPFGSEALFNVIPPAPNAGYVYGDNGPVELVWKKSSEYYYALARVFFKLYPLEFLDKSWGETYFNSFENLRLERNLMASLPSKEFLLQGEQLEIVDIERSIEANFNYDPTMFTSDVDAELVLRCTHIANNATYFTAFFNGGLAYNYYSGNHIITEGVPFSLATPPGINIQDVTIHDRGIPFNMGDTITVKFTAPIVEYALPDDSNVAYGELGCEGCVVPDATDPETIITITPIPLQFSIVAGNVKIFKGLGQLYTDLLRFSSLDTDISGSTAAYRQWEVNLVHRVGALLRPDSLKIGTNQGTVPDTGYEVVLHAARATESKWISALRVQLVQMGSRVLSPSGLYIPKDDASDWIFRVEVYNPIHPEIAAYSVITDHYAGTNSTGDNSTSNGFITNLEISPMVTSSAITIEFSGPDLFTVSGSEVGYMGYGLLGSQFTSEDKTVSFIIQQGNTPFTVGDKFVIATNFTTFSALDKQNCKLDWRHYGTYTTTTDTAMPQQITGLQNVLNFIFGYVDHLSALGFHINANDTPITDIETGRNLDWQLEVEKLVNVIYGGINAGDAYILNPFFDKLALQTPIGLMSTYTKSNFMDITSSQCCFSVTGEVIPVNDLFVVRTDEQAITYPNQPIYSAHVFIDEYEHVIVLNDKFSADSDSSLLFDSFLGEAIKSAKLTFIRQAVTNGKPTFDGFYLKGNDVARNISSSVDALQNVYDPVLTFNEELTSAHAMSLVGFEEKDYFNNIDISSATQMNFWRSMISAKGTNLSISAFTNYKEFSDSSTDEFWAYKVGTYGDARERNFPEIKVQPNDATRKFTSFQFYNSQDNQWVNPIPQHILVDANDDARWFSIDDLGTTLRFNAIKISEEITVTGNVFPQYVHLKKIYSTDIGFGATSNSANVVVIGARTLKVLAAGTYTVTGYSWINKTKLSPVKLFDYKERVLDNEICLWHPAIDVQAYSPLALVNIKDAYDPAYYNYTLQTFDNPNYKVLKPWDEQEVGKVWWDTSKLSYIPYYDGTVFPSLDARLARWGALAEYASVDLYEWTESPVHPSEFNELARSQEGDISIDASIRLSGEVGFVQNYESLKSTSVRPIAWSQASIGNNEAHPAFGPATFVAVYVSGDKLIIDTGRASDINLTEGRHFGGWDVVNSKPVGEVILGNLINYDIGSSLYPSNPEIVPSGSISEITIEPITDTTEIGTYIGAITLTSMMVSELIPEVPAIPAVYQLRMMSASGDYQDVIVDEWNLFNDPVTDATSLLDINFEKFGLKLTLKRNVSGNISSEDICNIVANPLNDIFIRETVNYIIFISQLTLSESKYSNNPTDFTDYGWKAWDQPSQLQLNGDLAPPLNRWKPYIGALISVPMSNELIESVEDPLSINLNLTRGITIYRYEHEWSQWNVLQESTQEKISNGHDAISFTLNVIEINPNRLSIYVNGSQIAPAEYVITDNVVNLVNSIPEAHSVFMLFRAFEPSTADLTVNEDDSKTRVRYRKDYQYTKIDQRSYTGNVIGSKYYFWVKNKSVVRPDQSMSLRNATNLLRTGESTFMLFSQLTPDASVESGVAYDSCSIAGLHRYVNDTDRYKLRFLRDFTLRDNPEEMSLKNVHTEWELLRPHQLTKIPSALWAALTDSVCASDAAGNNLPAKTRVDYDLKYGTRTRFGFGPGQIFCESSLALDSIINTLLNTSLTIQVGATSITDYVTMFNINASTTPESLKETWFTDPIVSRNTMNVLYRTARASQVNEVFFDVLNEALANNFEFTDLFKTSLITVNSSTVVKQQTSSEQIDEFF